MPPITPSVVNALSLTLCLSLTSGLDSREVGLAGTGRELAASEATLDAIAAAQTRAVGHFDSLPVDPVMIINIVNPYAEYGQGVFLNPGGEDIDDDNVTPS